jgi:hypothetical protein
MHGLHPDEQTACASLRGLITGLGRGRRAGRSDRIARSSIAGPHWVSEVYRVPRRLVFRCRLRWTTS